MRMGKFSLLSISAGLLLGGSLNAGVSLPTGRLDGMFVQNVGQYSSHVIARAVPSGLTVKRNALTVAGVDLVLENSTGPSLISMDMPMEARFNYFVGSDPSSWKKDVPTYKRVLLKEVYPGIDLVLTALKGNRVEFQWIVKPGADPNSISLKVSGGEIVPAGDGFDVIRRDRVVLSVRNVKAYQGAKEVAVKVDVKGDRTRYVVAEYDPSRTLVIDPDLATLTSSTFLGGGYHDYIYDIVLDGDGNVYVTGYTLSDNFPMDGWDNTDNGRADAFVAKLTPDLSTLSAATYIGGGRNDYAYGIAIDGSGNVFITGYTESGNYPTTGGAYQPDREGENDAFVSKFDPNLNNLLASTYVGGNEDDFAYAIAVDASGNVFIGGRTFSQDYPTTGGPGYSNPYFAEGFVSKLDNNLSNLLASTFIGGNYDDVINAMVVNSAGEVFVTGGTQSVNFPTTAGAYDETHNGGYDAFVAKFDNNLNLTAATLIGGDLGDIAYGITLDPSGNVYITGIDSSSLFPTTPGAYGRDFFGGATDVFVSRFSPDLTALLQSTTIGGSGDEYAYDIAVEPTTGKVFITGNTSSPDYPTTPFAYDYWFNDTYPISDVFVSEFNATLTDLIASTFLGGGYGDYARAIAVSGPNVYVGGYTESTNFPTTAGSYSTVPAGGIEAFVANLDPEVVVEYPIVEGKGRSSFEIRKNEIVVHLASASYVGADLYSVDGRLVRSVSLGYLPVGTYTINLGDLKKGSYVIHLRIGKDVYTRKLAR